MLPTLGFGHISDFACNCEMIFSRETNIPFSHYLGHNPRNKKRNHADTSPAKPGEGRGSAVTLTREEIDKFSCWTVNRSPTRNKRSLDFLETEGDIDFIWVSPEKLHDRSDDT